MSCEKEYVLSKTSEVINYNAEHTYVHVVNCQDFSNLDSNVTSLHIEIKTKYSSDQYEPEEARESGLFNLKQYLPNLCELKLEKIPDEFYNEILSGCPETLVKVIFDQGRIPIIPPNVKRVFFEIKSSLSNTDFDGSESMEAAFKNVLLEELSIYSKYRLNIHVCLPETKSLQLYNLTHQAMFEQGSTFKFRNTLRHLQEIIVDDEIYTVNEDFKTLETTTSSGVPLRIEFLSKKRKLDSEIKRQHTENPQKVAKSMSGNTIV